MKLNDTSIPDVKILIPEVYSDNRGFFFESFNQKTFERLIGRRINFVQDNHSMSRKGVLRGLHYQEEPMAQAKLIRVLAGEIFDVAVDIRPLSATYRQWVGHLLSAQNHHQLWIPEGFAHGFCALSETTEVEYKTTNFYSPQHEKCIAWNSAELAIEWPVFGKPLLSTKDAYGRKRVAE
ncbi:MAG: dTDP-4-dehydrorhamnose 3,5-epimerase [Cellvibrio sp. 79]|nr:MAG: dTDP-4-dehydrorhamnose 3,5-epimerase [Cellvibrio sp. 79]